MNDPIILNTKRIIGSLECVASKDVPKAIKRIDKLHYKHVAIQDANKEYTIIYYNDAKAVRHILPVYIRYEQSGGELDAISLDEHKMLGKAFGYDDEDIAWFIEDIEGEY